MGVIEVQVDPRYLTDDGYVPLTAPGATLFTSWLDVFGASGTGHKKGLVPDPGSSAGTTRFLREDGSWQVPAGGSGEANTASNVGTAGVGVFKAKVGVDLQFKKVNAGSAHITITDDTAHDEVDVDIAADVMLTDGSRAFTAEVGGVTPTLSASLATKGWVDGQFVAASAFIAASYQPLNGNLTAISAVASNTDLLPYYSAPITVATTAFAASGRALVGLAGGASKVPYWTSTSAAAMLDLDTDGTLVANSDTKLATQKATKTYVDQLITGLKWKQSVKAATTANGTLSTAFVNGAVIDGVTLATGDRILLKNQTTASQNGIRVVAASGTPPRASDADSGTELVDATVFVEQGTVNADTQWTCTTNAVIVPDTTALTFAQVSGAGTYVGGVFVSVVGNTIDLGVASASVLLGNATVTDGNPIQEIFLDSTLEFDGSAKLGRAAISGDVSIPGTSNTATIAGLAVSKLANASALSVLGRTANSTGSHADIAATAASGAVLRESGSTIGWGTVATAGLAAAAVTYAKIQDLGALAVMARSANTSGVGADLQASAGSGAVLRESSNTIGWGTIATAALGANIVTNAKLATMAAQKVKARKTAGTGDPEDASASEVLDFLGATQGQILYRGASTWDPLATGSAGQVLMTNGASANPSWSSALYALYESMTSVAGGDTVTNTAVATTFATTKTILAGAANVVGTVIKVTVAGVYVGQGSSTTQRLELLFGSTVIASTGTLTVGKSGTQGWRFEVECVVTTTGASAALECQGTCWLGTSTTACSTGTMHNSATVAVNLTASQAVTVRETMGAAVASWSVTMRSLLVHVEKKAP